jgi:hypothetical protein
MTDIGKAHAALERAEEAIRDAERARNEARGLELEREAA